MSYYIKLTHRSPEQDFISHSDSPRFAGAKDNSIHPYQHLGPPSVLPLSSSHIPALPIRLHHSTFVAHANQILHAKKQRRIVSNFHN